MSAIPLKRTSYAHVAINHQGVPVIAGTTMKVVELVEAHVAYGWSPEELHFQFPHITLGQVYSALAYYWDHKAELDADMARRDQFVERARQEAGPSQLIARLRQEGHLE
jgi:uncharacterized protein (DUF433 family)